MVLEFHRCAEGPGTVLNHTESRCGLCPLRPHAQATGVPLAAPLTIVPPTPRLAMFVPT